MESQIVGIIAQAGGVGIGLAALWLLHSAMTTQNESSRKVIEENTKSNQSLVVAVTQNTEVTRSLEETIERKLS